MSAIDRLLDGIAVPAVVRVRQTFERPRLEDPVAELAAQLKAKGTLTGVKRGHRIAITAGSRGITALPEMLRTLAAAVREAGAEPFLVPAMGSHGGATAEGQRNMLIGMGITEDAVGAPIRATMETVEIGRTAAGNPVYLDKYAHEADGILVINRLKPHVSFRGPYESGLAKMIVIGLGKQKGADTCHELGAGMMAENIPAMAAVTLAKANIIAGVAIIENAYHETSRLAVLAGSEIMAGEPALLEEARRLCPRLYFDSLDVLVIDEIGKDISGTGFDTNIVGRYHTPNISGGPRIARMAVLDLTERTHGNANGLGLADFTTRRVFDKFDFANTYPNSLTTTATASVKIPMVLGSDRQAIQAAIKTCNIADKGTVRLVRIKNTVALDEIEVSESLLGEVAASRYMTAAGGPYALPFDVAGNLR
ncbi:lactate racemase domain-containing protein [Anaeroselena agilis]|uniref:Lactate racemase domain-containing protein n=1 Tax=Anaeroselena agilis TaxID=3063788 RepID=A0ABU3P5U3_9FIRM|nr:lactate racemase domain-containing protein [Selenomonadales bacterium 4137-cl]